jgi:hypothetical protein
MSKPEQGLQGEHDDGPTLHDLLIGQTARIGWDELARHFARGAVIQVDSALDLVGIAAWVVGDETGRLQPLFDDGRVVRAGDEHARRWSDTQQEFWAVVIAPWVLVQEVQPRD